MFEMNAICPAEILLPRQDVEPETWACVACDQYTSQPEYWRKVAEIVSKEDCMA